jgi:endonuclease YncB( thermonuclease family)
MDYVGAVLMAGLCWAAVVNLGLVSVGPVGSSLAGEAPDPCPPVPGERVRVADVIDGDTLRLEDGRTLRLVSALAPKSGAGDDAAPTAKLAKAARAALEKAVEGRELALAFTGQRQDRHGRLLAHAFVDADPQRWLQREMIDKGLARAYVLEDNYRCVRQLLAREAVARDAEMGLWSTGLGALGRADQPERLAREIGRFAIVEGRVKTVGDRPRRTYLNFGTNWGQDFTVFVDRGDIARFERAEIDLKGLEGRRVRVRGWISDDRGPALHMTNPEQLELVDAR